MQVPGKEEFAQTLRYFAKRLEITGVNVQLGQRVTREQLLAQGFDEVVVATGIVPRTPRIPGVERANVVTYLDVLQRKLVLGPCVAIIGAGGIGFDVGEFLLHDPAVALPVSIDHWCREWGVDLQAQSNGGLVPPEAVKPYRQLFLLQRKTTRVGAGLGKTSGWVHRAVLQRNNVEMLAGVEYHSIDDAGFHITVNGVARVLAVDHVVLCAGQEPLTELMPPSGATVVPGAPRFHTIGGAALASELDAKRAIREGAMLAASL
jgi:2,4-dienoyl-CoA reductase (NADPH2)